MLRAVARAWSGAQRPIGALGGDAGGSAAGSGRGLGLGPAGALGAGREDEPVLERAAQLAGDGIGHRRREHPAELPRSRLPLREAVHRQPRPR